MKRSCFGSIFRYFVCLRTKQISLGKNVHLGSLSLLIYKSQGTDSNDQCELMLTGKVPSQKEKDSISLSDRMLFENVKFRQKRMLFSDRELAWHAQASGLIPSTTQVS